MNIEEVKAFFSKRPDLTYPAEVLESSEMIPVGSVFPITTLISGHVIPGLFVTCDSEICKYFDIEYPPPSPILQFRMVDLHRTVFALEVLLLFEDGKLMRLHLDPRHEMTRHYLKMGLKKTIIAFHFHNQDSGQLIDSITNLDEGQIEWFERNLRLSKKLSSNKDYELLSKMIRDGELLRNRKARCFQFYDDLNRDMLVEETDRLAKMRGVKYYHTKPK